MFTNVNTQDLRIIAVDEIAIHKGQKYATVFINYETRQVFAVVKGKTQKAVESVFRERQKFCVHGIIGARQTGASNEHEHQTQFS